MNTKKPPLVVIAGPTASGKSSLALALSRLTPAVIINADASQVYRDLRIVTARPSPEEEAQAPHALFGYLDGAINCTAAQWAKDAAHAIKQAEKEKRLPILVGGTGLYLRTLLEGIAPVPEIDPNVRDQVRGMEQSKAYAALEIADPAAALRLNANDRTRICRALEVALSTGKPLRDWQAQLSGGIGEAHQITGLALLPPRDWLRARCDQRFENMLDNGGIEEVGALLERGLDANLPIMRAIGVKEIATLIEHPAQRDLCVERAKAATRQYAKRQYTWFRNQLPAAWEKSETQLNHDSVNELAIKLYEMTLTS